MAKKMGGLGKGLGAIFIENDNEENEFIVVLPANKEEHWGEASVIIK